MNYEQMQLAKAAGRASGLAATETPEQAVAFVEWSTKMETAEARELQMLHAGIFTALMTSGIDQTLCPSTSTDTIYAEAERLAKMVAVELYRGRDAAA